MIHLLRSSGMLSQHAIQPGSGLGQSAAGQEPKIPLGALDGIRNAAMSGAPLAQGLIELIAPLTQQQIAQSLTENRSEALAQHPFVRYVDMNRALLGAMGLPTEAKGVKVYIVGENNESHAKDVRASVIGHVGLGRGARTETYSVPNIDNVKAGGFTYGPEQVERLLEGRELRERLADGNLSLDQLTKLGVYDMQELVLYRHQQLAAVQGEAKTSKEEGLNMRLVNMSWSLSYRKAAKNLVKQALLDRAKPKGHPERIVRDTKVARYLEALLGCRVTEDNMPELIDLIAERIHGEAQKPNHAGYTQTIRKRLSTALSDARNERIMVFAAAGNDRTDRAHHLSVGLDDGVQGMVSVGAADIGDPETDGDDRVWAKSSKGQLTLVGPGVNVPLKEADGLIQELSGTSTACPFLIGLASLMATANPKASPDDIERLMKEATTTVEGSKAGLPDPVCAVMNARQLLIRETKKKTAPSPDGGAQGDARLRKSVLHLFAEGRRSVMVKLEDMDG